MDLLILISVASIISIVIDFIASNANVILVLPNIRLLARSNDRLRQSNPMAPKIANDDYGNLDSVSQKVSALKLPSQRLVETAFPGDPLKRFKEGGPLGSWLSDEDLTNHPIASAVAAGLGTPIQLIL